MTTTLNPGEESQLLQTIEMFEVITQSQPQDYQSLEILKEAYTKLGREDDVANRVRACLKFAPADRLSFAPDCGLSQTARWAAKQKLKNMVEGVKRVREEIGVK